jgi:hypothetical protein
MNFRSNIKYLVGLALVVTYPNLATWLPAVAYN